MFNKQVLLQGKVGVALFSSLSSLRVFLEMQNRKGVWDFSVALHGLEVNLVSAYLK